MKKVSRKKTQAKSRTIARPALSRTDAIIWKRACLFFAPAVYIFAVLVLFQYGTVQLVLAFYANPLPETLPQVDLTTQIKKPPVKIVGKIGIPVRLKIPSIGVNAVIDSVGLLPNGSMGLPKLPRNAAWYMLGPKPGETGSAAIAGHLNWWYGAKGVFQNLNALKPGDLITVQDDKGATSTFAVRESRALGQHDDASIVFRSYDGIAHLNLITCDGVWDKVTKSYSKRLVVFAEKVE